MSAFAPPDDVASPCIRSCCLDGDNVCMGCGRSLEEIVRWSNAAVDEKRAILARSRLRAEQRAQLTSRPSGAVRRP